MLVSKLKFYLLLIFTNCFPFLSKMEHWLFIYFCKLFILQILNKWNLAQFFCFCWLWHVFDSNITCIESWSYMQRRLELLIDEPWWKILGQVEFEEAWIDVRKYWIAYLNDKCNELDFSLPLLLKAFYGENNNWLGREVHRLDGLY